MLKDMKRATIKRSLIWIIIVFAIGVAVEAYNFKETIAYIKGPEDILKTSSDELKDVVYGEVDLSKTATLGCFSEEYEKESGKKTTTYYYYVISAGDASNPKYIGLKVKACNYNTLERITDEYYDYLDGNISEISTKLKIQGKVRTMESDAYGHFKTALKSAGFTDDDITNECLDLMIVENGIGAQTMVWPIIGAVCMGISILGLIYVVLGGGQIKLKKKLRKMGPQAAEQAEIDFKSGTLFGKSLKIGKQFTFFIKGTKNMLIPNNEIVWAYNRKVDHYTNGIHTGVTYSVVVYTKDKKKYEFSSKSELVGNQVLDFYYNMTDSIVLGYSSELQKMFRKNYNDFLNLAYNINQFGVKNQPDGNNQYNNTPESNSNYAEQQNTVNKATEQQNTVNKATEQQNTENKATEQQNTDNIATEQDTQTSQVANQNTSDQKNESENSSIDNSVNGNLDNIDKI